MSTPSPDPRDDYHEFKKAFRATQLASRRLQSVIETDDTPSSTSAAAVNTRPTEAQARPLGIRNQPAVGVVLDGNVPVPEPGLLSPFRDRRQTNQDRRSRRQGMVFDDQGQVYSTEGKNN